MKRALFLKNVLRSSRQYWFLNTAKLAVVVALTGLVFLLPAQAAGQLPSGSGWHVLANTQMSSMCVGNVPNGMYSDKTMTTTTNYDFNCNEIMPWSGGAIDDAHQRLIVWGGGHSDYAGNEVFVLNLSGTPSWQLFTNPTIPVPFNWDGNSWEGLNPYYVRLADGGTYKAGATPASRHTYNGLQYVPYQNKLYSFGGAVANVGFLSSEVWTLDMGAKTWTMVGPPFSQSPGFPTTAYNPTNGHVVMHDKNWSLFDYDPHTNSWTTLTTSYHVDDGTTAAIDPVNNLLVFVGSAGTTNNTTYPSVPTSHTVQVFSLSAPYSMQAWNPASCDLTYRNGGLAWDSALGLMVGYPGGGNQVYFLNTGPATVATPYGSVPSHQCLDVPISLNPAPAKGVDYPQDPEGTLPDQSGDNYGVYGRFEYVPSLDVFVVMNDHTQNAWILRLTGGSAAPDYSLSSSANSLTVVAGGSSATATINTTVSGGFNNSIALSAVGMPTGMSVSFSPTSIAAPGAGTSTMTVSASSGTATGTYPIVVSGFGGGDTHTAVVSVTVTSNGQPTLTVSALPSSLTVAQGSNASSSITTTIGGSFNNAVRLSASGVPSGASVTFNPATIPAPGAGTSAMTVSAGSTTQVGIYPITVTATGGGLSPTTTLTLTVTQSQGPNLTVSASPASLTLGQGSQGTSLITTTGSGGFNSQVALSATGVPTGTTVSFAPTPISAPGSGTSTMTINVGAATPTGTYPMIVTATGGGLAPTTTVTLTVTNSLSWQQGFNYRATAGYVTDPSNTTHVLATTAYPTQVGTVTFGWLNTQLVYSRDRSTGVDARLAGINYVSNGSPATFYVDLPSAGSYNLSLAMGDEGYTQCWTMCQVQFLDGSTVVGTITGNPLIATFNDAKDDNWSASTWPGSNLTLPINMSGTRLTMVVGTTQNSGDVTPIAFLGITQNSGSANFTVTPSPSSVNVMQGAQGTSTITTTVSGGFNSAIALSASGLPSGTTVNFNPASISAPGSGTSTMTITVGAGTAVGTYPITVSASGGGIQHTAIVNLTVTSSQPTLSVSASPASLTVVQGAQGTSTITTVIGGGFNKPVMLSATGMPSGTTVSFKPTIIPAPGAGNSTMTITVGASTAPGTYPLTVAAYPALCPPPKAAKQAYTIVILTVTTSQPSLTVAANPASLSVVQGTQGTSTITTTIGGGFNNAVALSASGVPTGTAFAFDPSTIPAPGAGNSTFTISAGATTPPGTYPITITAAGGGLAPTTVVTLTVTTSSGGGNGITVSDVTGQGQTNRFVSVGRFFKQGGIPHFAQAVLGQTPILTQCDVKNRWPDGSLKFAIVSFVLPSLSSGGTAVSFQDQSTGNNTGYLQQGDMLDPAYDFDATMQLTGAVSPTISARSMLQGGNFRYWLQGPIVTAVIIEDRDNRTADVNTDGAAGNPLHPIFEAWFYPQGHKVEVGFTLENTWASSTATNSARNQTFSLALTTGSANPLTQLTQPTFTQIIFSRWRRSFWIDGAPGPIQFDFNWPYLASTGAYANFDPAFTPNSSDLASMYATYTGLPSGRLTIPGIDQLNGNGGIGNYDENPNGTGYHPWIGPYTQWDVDYLMTGDPRMQQMMTDNADLSGRYPIFFREADHNAGTGMYFDAPTTGSVDTYGRVVSINARQQATLNLYSSWNTACSGNAADLIATSLPSDGTGWYTVPSDTSHIPDFAYVPYTLTGKYYYLEHEIMQAGFVAGYGMGCYSPTASYGRQAHYGLNYQSTRALAWELRTLAYAAIISPDSSPEQAYFASKLQNNFAMIEGEHALPLTVAGADAAWSYSWGEKYFQYSQAANLSTLNFWRMGDCAGPDPNCYVEGGVGALNNVNAGVVQSAESGFMSSFIDIVFGLVKQLGIIDTTPMLQWDARRYFNILLNPAVNHYLIEQYVYPTTLVGPPCYNPSNPGCIWITDWGTFQSGYLVLPSSWSVTQADYGAEAASALSFMTNLTVDGYHGADAWNFFRTSDATQLGIVYHNEPQWCIKPMQ